MLVFQGSCIGVDTPIRPWEKKLILMGVKSKEDQVQNFKFTDQMTDDKIAT